MIYSPDRHLKLAETNWSGELALQEVSSIYRELSQRLFNDERISIYNSLYVGRSGILWGLIEIAKFLNQNLSFDPIELVDQIHQSYLEKPDSELIEPSFLAGEAGILLTKYKITKSSVTRNRLSQIIETNFHNQANEMFFGSPGTLLASLHVGEISLFKKGAHLLFESWLEVDDTWIWNQKFDDHVAQSIGAAHGLAGNIQVLLKGQNHLSENQQETLIKRAASTLIKTAVREKGFANWPAKFKQEQESLRLQWCHGAPGIITSLNDYPVNKSVELEKLLIEAGELIWFSGPLQKGIGLCHGTDGNGYAFLSLYKRTGNQIWLDRARSFAMHAITQRSENPTLWTGSTGLALYLISCIEERVDFPCLDYF